MKYEWYSDDVDPHRVERRLNELEGQGLEIVYVFPITKSSCGYVYSSVVIVSRKEKK